MVIIREAPTLTDDEYRQLSDMLIAVVDDGASIGFLPPLARAEADAYWHGVLGPQRVLLLAEDQAAWARRISERDTTAVMIEPVTMKQLIEQVFEVTPLSDEEAENN